MAASTSRNKQVVERYEAIFKGTAEPVVTKENYTKDISEALNWYAAHEDEKKKRKWVTDYVAKAKMTDLIPLLSKAHDSEFIQLGALIRIKSKGGYLSEAHEKYITDKLASIKAKALEKIEAEKKEKPVIAVKKDDIVDTYCTDIDLAIDEFIKTKKTSFNISGYIAAKTISSSNAKRIAERYEDMVAELAEAMEGKDEQLVEGYSFFTKAELKKFHAFIQGIITGCAQTKVVTTRKPRAKKEKPASVLVAKMKYKKEDSELGLTSVDPKTIVGASELWVYNTESRKIMVFKALGSGKLTVKGSKIVDYDVATSSSCVLRKPADFFAAGLAKKTLESTFKAVKTTKKSPRNSINEECILVKVF